MEHTRQETVAVNANKTPIELLDKSNIGDIDYIPTKPVENQAFTLTFPNNISNEAVETIIRLVDLITKKPKSLMQLKRMVDEAEEEEIRSKYLKLKAQADVQTDEKARTRSLEDLFDYVMEHNSLITNEHVMRDTHSRLTKLILDEDKLRFREYYAKFRDTFKAMVEDIEDI